MTTINRARRAFFKQGLGPNNIAHHMPWAVRAFYDACRRCDDCITACERRLLVRGDGGFPTADFSRAGCSFCGTCVDACRHDALMFHPGPAWSLQARIGDRCLASQVTICRTCGEYCEQNAIHFRLALGGRAIPELRTDLCNGCGECVAVCPTHAIHMEATI